MIILQAVSLASLFIMVVWGILYHNIIFDFLGTLAFGCLMAGLILFSLSFYKEYRGLRSGGVMGLIIFLMFFGGYVIVCLQTDRYIDFFKFIFHI